MFLSISNLEVHVEGACVLKGANLSLENGEIHALMGVNGSGKSSLAATLMGHPSYKIMGGDISFQGEKINGLSPDKRAGKGLFLAFQYPHEIEGVRFFDFLRQAYNALHAGTDKQCGIKAFKKLVDEKCTLLGIDSDFLDRSLNVGFSGGEKKRAEILQLAVLQPKLVILDEIDSGLDVDALRVVCDGIVHLKQSNPDMTFLVITHYSRILTYLKPDVVHVMNNGVITQSGDAALADRIEKNGYDGV